MAMLAEPRQRKRYNLVPRGKALYEDDSRYGTKMLEKMGWSKGRGLGANEDGSQDFVRIRYKNDVQGLGFEQRDDQWTQHENSFSGLLKSLNGEEIDDKEKDNIKSVESEDEAPRMGFGFQNGDNKEKESKKKEKKSKLKEKISGVSLEEKSKQSKARVHYKKFTKGKDLSQYSEKDLANIFGKKAAEDENDAAANLYQQLNQNCDERAAMIADDKIVGENFAGVQTISTGLSVADYFKMKMESLKNRTTQLNTAPNLDPDLDHQTKNDVITNDNSSKKKKKKKGDKTKERPHDEKQSMEDIDAASTNDSHKKKKKRTRDDDNATDGKNDLNLNPEDIELVIPKKKKKKSKHQELTDVTVGTSQEINASCNSIITETAIVNESSETLAITENEGKKKKKSKKRHLQSDTQDDSLIDHIPEKVKRKAVSDPQDLEHIEIVEDLQTKLTDFNVYRISSFCAEKFRNLNLSFFPNSTLPHIEGYSLSKDLKLNIQTMPTDEMRITKLWDNTISKYALVEKETRKAYQKYVKQTYKARREKQQRPSLHFKTWKRKNAFAII